MQMRQLGSEGPDVSVIGFGAWPIGGQMGSFRGERWRASLARVARLTALAQAWGITTSQLAIAWVLANPAVTVALVGAKTARQVEENAAAAAVQLSAERIRAIEDLVAGYRAPLSGE